MTSPLRAAALLAVGLSLGGCSGGADGTGAAPTATSASSAPASTASPTGAASTSQEQVAADFCSGRDELTVLGTQMKAGGQQAFLDQLPTYVERIDALQPPDALAADYATYRAGWDSIGDALEGATPDDPTLATKVQAAVAANPGAEAAEESLKAWAAQNCPAASASPTAG